MQSASTGDFWQDLAENTLEAIGGEEFIPQLLNTMRELIEETKHMSIKEATEYFRQVRENEERRARERNKLKKVG